MAYQPRKTIRHSLNIADELGANPQLSDLRVKAAHTSASKSIVSPKHNPIYKHLQDKKLTQIYKESSFNPQRLLIEVASLPHADQDKRMSIPNPQIEIMSNNSPRILSFRRRMRKSAAVHLPPQHKVTF